MKKFNPITNGQRHKIAFEKNQLIKNNKIIKTLLKKYNFCKGRSSQTGHITSRYKGSGHKNLYHIMKTTKKEYKAVTVGILYNSNQNAFISLNFDLETKKFFKSINIQGMLPGSISQYNKENIRNITGNSTLLKNLPVGSIISLISKKNKICFIKSAGTYGQILEKLENSCKLRLPSGKVIKLPLNSTVTVGTVSNSKYKLNVFGKAGYNRNKGKGIRPHVRGIAMNPVDHPHGGRTNGGCIPVTPWGIPTKGKKTVHLK